MTHPNPLVFKFRLYVAGNAPNSIEALSNLRELCKQYLLGCHEIEVVDVFVHPQRALADGVLMTPMLVKLAPAPTQKIVGTLSQTATVLQVMGLPVLVP